jgi:hypothetical protein
MSFADVHRGGERSGGAGGAGSAPLDEDAFASCSRQARSRAIPSAGPRLTPLQVQSSIFQLTTNVTSFKRLVDALVRPPTPQRFLPRVRACAAH